jgi:hypothetical protein
MNLCPYCQRHGATNYMVQAIDKLQTYETCTVCDFDTKIYFEPRTPATAVS